MMDQRPDGPLSAGMVWGGRLESGIADHRWKSYGHALAVLVTCNLLGWVCIGFLAPTNILMIYLIGILFVAFRSGQGPSLTTCVLGILSFDFFIVPPRFTFAATDSQYLITLLVLTAVTSAFSAMMERNRRQNTEARVRGSMATALYTLSCELAANQDPLPLLGTAVRNLDRIMGCRTSILLPGPEGRLEVRGGPWMSVPRGSLDEQTADWVFRTGSVAGRGTGIFPAAESYFLPLMVSGRPVGVLGILSRDSDRVPAPEQRHFLQSLANQIGASMEYARLAEETRRSRLRVETEQLRNGLLSSVSHDFRTPLAVITGSASSLLERGGRLADDSSRELVQNIYDESERLNHLLSNLLEMTRLSTDRILLKRELQPLEEILGAALSRLDKRLGDRLLSIDLPEELPMVPLDSVLMEQLFINLIDNALKYTPAHASLGVSARSLGDSLRVEVSDRGPGIELGDEERIFEKFQRGSTAAGMGGVGLGLAICRCIVEAHGGRIGVQNRPEGGATFHFTVPLEPGDGLLIAKDA